MWDNISNCYVLCIYTFIIDVYNNTEPDCLASRTASHNVMHYKVRPFDFKLQSEPR